MPITQTVEIPVSREITLKVPPEVPAGRTILTFTPAPANNPAAQDSELFEKYADELNAEAEDVLSYQSMYLDEAADKQPIEK